MSEPEQAIGPNDSTIDDYGIEETLEVIHEIASRRKQLFGILGWTLAGLLTVGAMGGIVSFVYIPIATGGPLTQPGVAGASVLLGFGVFFLVKRRASSLKSGQRGAAKWLLVLTCASYALIAPRRRHADLRSERVRCHQQPFASLRFSPSSPDIFDRTSRIGCAVASSFSRRATFASSWRTLGLRGLCSAGFAPRLFGVRP